MTGVAVIGTGFGTLTHARALRAAGLDVVAGTGVPEWWSKASEGGGWLGAQGSHVIDQIRTTLGEITGVSASLLNVATHGWTSEDTFSVHFRTASGCEGVMQSRAAPPTGARS